MTSTDRPTRDWSFARRPGWLFSHVFVGLCILGMFWAATWQLSRHNQRVDLNAIVEARATAEPVTLTEALDGSGVGASRLPEIGDAVEFTAVAVDAVWLDTEFVRIANRSQNGEAGDWVVGLAELDDGQLLLVNRGFIRREIEADPIPPDQLEGVRLIGWLRASEQRGTFGPTDSGEGRAPRVDIDELAERVVAGGFDGSLAPVWLELESPTGEGYPVPIPLPPADNGPHLNYVGQWLIFGSLTTLFYGLTLRKFATEAAKRRD